MYKFFQIKSLSEKFLKFASNFPGEFEKLFLDILSNKQKILENFTEMTDEEMIETELLLVAKNQKLISFFGMFPEHDQDLIDFILSLAEDFGLKYFEADIIYDKYTGKHLCFYNPQNPDSIKAAKLSVWIAKERKNKTLPSEIHWILDGIVAGFSVEQIRSFINEKTKDKANFNTKIVNYLPKTLCSLFLLEES